jgi:hypothetical protein
MVLRVSGSTTQVVTKAVRFADQKIEPKSGIIYFFEESLMNFLGNADSPRWDESLNLLDSLTVRLTSRCFSLAKTSVPANFELHDITPWR